MSEWISICKNQDLIAGTGVCALHQGEQVAVYKMHGTEELYALSNFDPFGEANVLSRGLTGSIGETLVVASPLYKQHFCLKTGACLEDSTVKIKTYQVRLHDNHIQLLAA